MDIPYQWFSSAPPVPTYYPSPAPSTDPSPAPRPHQQLHDQYVHQQQPFDQLQSNVGPARVHGPGSPRRARTQPENADRYSDAVFLENPPSYRPGTPSSMTSPYSPYEYGVRHRSRSFSFPDGNLPVASPIPSGGSAESLGSTSQPRNYDLPRTRAKHKKHRLTDAERKKICEYHIKYKNARQEDIGAIFGVERSTISKILKDKDRWLKITAHAEANPYKAKRPSKYPEIEEVLENSLQHWTDSKTPITDQLIRQKGLEIAASFGYTLEQFKGSSGWVENTKHRLNIKRGEWRNARRFPTPPTKFVQLPPKVMPDTPVIKPYEPQPKPKCRTPPPLSMTKEEALALIMRPVARPTLMDPALFRLAGLPDPFAPPPLAQGQIGYVAPPTVADPPQPSLHHGANETGVGMSDGGANTGVNSAAAHPTYEDAEKALKIVISFLDSNGRDIIKDDDRQALDRISSELSQCASRLSSQHTSA